MNGALIIALPTLGKALDFSESELQWPLNVYACVSTISFNRRIAAHILVASDRLSYGSLLLLFGRLADVVGSKRMFLLGTGFFTIWCVSPPRRVHRSTRPSARAATRPDLFRPHNLRIYVRRCIIERRLDRARSHWARRTACSVFNAQHSTLDLNVPRSAWASLALCRSIATGVALNKVALIVFVALTGVGAAANTPTGELLYFCRSSSFRRHVGVSCRAVPPFRRDDSRSPFSCLRRAVWTASRSERQAMRYDAVQKAHRSGIGRRQEGSCRRQEGSCRETVV